MLSPCFNTNVAVPFINSISPYIPLTEVSESVTVNSKFCSKSACSPRTVLETVKLPVFSSLVTVRYSVFVSSSDFEGMSNSMLEAMAIGLPVVCTDCPIGGARMVIKNNINGILTPVGDDRIFADEIIGLLKNPEKAKRLGKQASELREQLNIKKIAKEWEKLFED